MNLYMWQLCSAGREQDASNGLKGSVQRYKYYCVGALSARRHVYMTYEPQETTARTRQSVLWYAEPNLTKIMVVFCP
jgi:hypothetical protein